MQLTPRNIEILKIIVEEFIESGELVGSKSLLKKYDLGVSPATVRNDMAKLEELDLVYQPYNSAGRYPTSKGLKAFVHYLMEEMPIHLLKEENFENDKIENFYDYIYNLIFHLSNSTKEICFLTIPSKKIVEVNGIKYFLEKNFDKQNNVLEILDFLENREKFLSGINALLIREIDLNIFIGEEIIGFPIFKETSIIIREMNVNGAKSYLGIFGNLNMNYNFNISAIKGIV